MTPFLDLFDGLEEETKVCSMCLVAKPLSMFGFDGGSKYRRHECRECARQQGKFLKELKKTISPPPKDHRCPICDRNEEEARGHNKKKKTVWRADHSHETGKFRAWLCDKCNLALGNLADSIQRCKNAMDYLTEHSQ